MHENLTRTNSNGELEINWVCLKDKCPQNCCGYFEGNLTRHVSINNIEHHDIIILPKEAEKFKSAGLGEYLEEKKENFYFKLGEDRSCPFFKNNKCSQYKNRPSLCRAYPFYIDLFSGLNIDTGCPGVGKGWTNIKKIKPFLKALIKVYKKHINDIQK